MPIGLPEIASGVSAAGGIFNTLKSIFNPGPSQSELMKWQEQMLDKQFNFQAEQAQLNRDFQAEQVRQAQDWNSIVSQVERAQKAGVNPYSLVASGSYGSAAGSPAASGSQVGGAVIPEPAPNTALQSAQSFSAVAAAMANLADAKQKGVNTNYLEQAMDDLLERNKLQNNYQGLLNGFQSIINKYQDKRSQQELTEVISRCELLSSQTDLSVHQVDVQKAEIFEMVSKAHLNQAEYNQINRFLNSFFDSYYKSVIDKNKAQANEANTQAAANTAYTNLTNVHKQLADLELSIQKASNEQQKTAAIAQYTQAADQAGILTEQMKVALELAIKNKDWYEVNQIISILTSSAEVYSNLRGAGKKGSLNINNNMPGKLQLSQ